MTWKLTDMFRKSDAKSTPSLQAAPSGSTHDPVSKEAQPDQANLGEAPPNQMSSDTTKEDKMASTDISNLSDISGFIGACLVDTETGLMMASEGGENFDLETLNRAGDEPDVIDAFLS